MPKKPDKRIEPAKQMYLDGMKLVEIASQLELPEGTVRRWKSTHKWDSERSDKSKANVRKKRGGQPGNKNATGPPRNQHARKHGLFSKWIPAEINEIIGEMPTDPLDILWHNIELQYANIIHSQNILYVNDKNDKTKEVTMDGDNVTAYEIQQAWDKQAGNMSALSRSMKTLMSMIKEYDELLHKNWNTATEIQKAQLEQIRAQTKKLEEEKDSTANDDTQETMNAITDIVEQMKPVGDDEV